jgi:asparagine N-glycosylation enzyme membrane subunit Stt3
VIALQALTLFIIATVQGAETPYMALKMIYFAIYPMAVLGALMLARLLGRSRVADTIGWLVAALLLLAARPALTAPRAVAVVDLDLAQAGRWLRSNGAASCTDYLVADAETAYWLHLAVLGNSRSSERMQEVDRYEPRAAMAPWITAAGRRYAIADLRLLPDEIRSRVTILARFGHGAVVTGQGATIKGCD